MKYHPFLKILTWILSIKLVKISNKVKLVNRKSMRNTNWNCLKWMKCIWNLWRSSNREANLQDYHPDSVNRIKVKVPTHQGLKNHTQDLNRGDTLPEIKMMTVNRKLLMKKSTTFWKKTRNSAKENMTFLMILLQFRLIYRKAIIAKWPLFDWNIVTWMNMERACWPITVSYATNHHQKVNLLI